MPKIDIERNSWLEEAKVDYATGGFWNGNLLVTLTFKAGSCPDNAFIAKVLSKIGEQKLPKRRIVRITGVLSPTDQDLAKLVLMLHDYGYMVQVVLREIPNLTWLPYVSWVIYRTVEPNVPMAFNELWYEPIETAEIIEPVLPRPLVNRLTGQFVDQYLYLKRAGSMSVVTKFVVESQRNWILL